MKTAQKSTSSTGIAAAALVIAVLALAPFLGGRDTVTYTAILAVLALIAAGVMVFSRGSSQPVGLWPIVVFAGLIAASAVVTVSMRATVEQFLYFAACGAAAIAASSSLREDNRFSAAAFALVGVGLALGAMAVVEFWESGDGWRVFGPFLNPGFFGGYLVMVVPAALAVFLAGRSVAVVAGGGLAWGFSLSALLLTGTRFALAFTAISLILFMIMAIWVRAIGRKQLARLGIAALVGVAAVVLFMAPTENRIKGEGAAQQSHSLPFRFATWKGTANIIRANPVFGTGAGTFELVFQQYMAAGYTRMAHNSYLELAAENGIPALAAGAAAFGVLFLAGLKNLRRDDADGSQLLLPRGASLIACAFAAGLIGALGRNLFDSDLHNPGVGFTFWILAGAFAARVPYDKMINPAKAVKAVIAVLLGAMIVIWLLFAMARQSADAAMQSLINGDPAVGIEQLRTAVKYDPLSGDYRMTLGQSLAYTAGSDRSRWQEGVAAVRKSIKLEPTRARNMIALGRILSAKGDDKGAAEMFRKALAVDPHATPAMVALADILKQSDKTKSEAEQVYEGLIRQESTPIEQLRGVPEMVNPDYAWAHFYFAEKYLSEKRWDEAAKHFIAVIDRLELRKSYTVQREAAEAAQMVDPDEEAELEDLLQQSKEGLEYARAK